MKVTIYNCHDKELSKKISNIQKELYSTPMNKRSWAFNKMYQNMFEVFAEKGYLNPKLGYSMYIVRTIENDEDYMPRLITYVQRTDDRNIISIAFNADIKETPES